MTRKLSGVGLWVSVCLRPLYLLSHHAVSAEFDRNKPITFTGTVKKVDWMNPHIYTHIEAKDANGKTVVYQVEGGAPNSLFRNGWRAGTLKIGETVTVSGSRAKSEDFNASRQRNDHQGRWNARFRRCRGGKLISVNHRGTETQRRPAKSL